MKKTKKFEDGGSTGGRYVDMGESRVFVPDTPDAVAGPVAAGIGPVRNGPMGGGVGGLNELNSSSPPATLMPFVNGNNEPGRLPTGAGLGGGQDVSRSLLENSPAMERALAMGPLAERVPMGQRMPPRGRGIGGSLAGMGGMKKGGTVKKMAKGGSVSSASKRGDGCAIKGKTKGRII